MGDSAEVIEKLPGLQFHGVNSTLTSNARGTLTGTITMSCQVHDRELWNLAVDKFEDFKVFSTTTEEIFDALSSALHGADDDLHAAQQREQAALMLVAQKELKIAELEGILASIGVELGIE